MTKKSLRPRGPPLRTSTDWLQQRGRRAQTAARQFSDNVLCCVRPAANKRVAPGTDRAALADGAYEQIEENLKRQKIKDLQRIFGKVYRPYLGKQEINANM